MGSPRMRPFGLRRARRSASQAAGVLDARAVDAERGHEALERFAVGLDVAGDPRQRVPGGVPSWSFAKRRARFTPAVEPAR